MRRQPSREAIEAHSRAIQAEAIAKNALEMVKINARTVTKAYAVALAAITLATTIAAICIQNLHG